MKTLKEFIKDFYREVKEKYWVDPVWSKVITAAIIAISTTFYLLIKALVEQISIKTAFKELVYFLTLKTYVDNFIIIGIIFIFLFMAIRFLNKTIK